MCLARRQTSIDPVLDRSDLPWQQMQLPKQASCARRWTLFVSSAGKLTLTFHEATVATTRPGSSGPLPDHLVWTSCSLRLPAGNALAWFLSDG